MKLLLALAAVAGGGNVACSADQLPSGVSPEGGAGGAGTAGASGAPASSAGSGGIAPEPSVLVFSRTAGYRHDSISAGVQALTELGRQRGWSVTATEDAGRFTDAGLADFGAVIFLSTTGDVLNDEQQAAFERFIRQGRGFVGIHAASDTEYEWPWYGQLVGAYFREHPPVQVADVIVEDAASAAAAGLPAPWRRSDEWYAFRSNPRPVVHVLLALDESSYTPGAANMGGDHPIAWYHEHDGGRAFYTALGHTTESYSDELFLGHLAGGIAWALAPP